MKQRRQVAEQHIRWGCFLMIKSCRCINICLPCSGFPVPWSPLPWEPSFTCSHFSDHSCNHILDLVSAENRSTSKIYHFLLCHLSHHSLLFFFFLFNSYFLNLHFLLLNIPIRTDLAQVISLFRYGQLLESSSWFLGCPSEFLSSNPKLTMAVLNFEVWSGSGSPFPNSQDPS